MHGCRKQLRFRRCHGRAGQKVKSTSENKMENSLVIGICASTTIMHHDQHNQQQKTQKQTQPDVSEAAFKSQGSQNSRMYGNVGVRWRLRLSLCVGATRATTT